MNLHSGYTIKLLDKLLSYFVSKCSHLHLLKQINFSPLRIIVSVSQSLISLHLIHNYTHSKKCHLKTVFLYT